MGEGADLPGAVLFACSRNAVRSLMADAILKLLAGRRDAPQALFGFF